MSRFTSITLSHGRRQVPQLLGGEGDEVTEEVWRMRVSDHRSFLFPEVLYRYSPLHFPVVFQSCLILRMAAPEPSCDSVLTGVWI